jgi:outer membrane PBP1 activator LpoA protein
MKKYTLSMFVVASILACIGGCTPTTVNNTTTISSNITKSDTLVGDDALDILNKAGIDTDIELSDLDKLEKALLLADEDFIETSLEILETINQQNLSDNDFIDYCLLASKNYIRVFEIKLAEKQLQKPRFTSLIKNRGSSIRKQTLQLQAEIQFALGNYDQGLKALIDYSKTLRRKREIREVNDEIWHRISGLPYQYLQQGSDHSDNIIAGWLQLAAASRGYVTHPNEQQYIFKQWRRSWRNHPAAKTPPIQFSGSQRVANPDQVALLLPLQEQYQIPSQTVINGFFDAYYQALNLETNKSQMTPEVRIYDTSNQKIQTVYNRAVSDGAEMIIGPMRQSEVEKLITATSLPVPTLSLNRLDNKYPIEIRNFYQFGLSPLDELTQIADRALIKGLNNVLLITPDNSWGTQSAEFFKQYWAENGGSLFEEVSYPSSVNDFTQFLKQPLQIDLSEQRGLKIKRFINSRVKFTARRRQDIDLVVMLGYPLKARQIKPALDFLYASDIPVMATSHIYNGDIQEALDRDLSGVEFSSMPWTLSGHLGKDLNPDKQLHTAYRHLYALGYDAFLVYRNLQRLQSDKIPPIFGSTGLLSLKNNSVVREQKWAKFERGKVIEIH